MNRIFKLRSELETLCAALEACEETDDLGVATQLLEYKIEKAKAEIMELEKQEIERRKLLLTNAKGMCGV